MNDVLEVYRLDAGSYGYPVVLRPPDKVRPLAPSGLEIDLGYIFRR